ncbi:MAG: hypothetical protein M1838_004133 [Thelocarpon superellum]|nr:MAG: hypothetical protein M1838_004133 [Thelocarpon superellum]
MASDEEDVYRPKDAIAASVRATMVTGTAGAIVSGVQNTLTKQNVGAFGVFTRTGGTIATFAAMGASYEFSKSAAANLREKDDSWNPTVGGFVAGAVMVRTLPAVLGYGAAAAVLFGTFDYTGGVLNGYGKDPEVDEFERKQQLRKNRRRPVAETISEIGEGRGIYAPGYAERRRERLKERYGVDVGPASSSGA